MTLLLLPDTFKAEVRRAGPGFVLEYEETFHVAEPPGFLESCQAQAEASVDFLRDLNEGNNSWATPNADGSPGATLHVHIVSDKREDPLAGLLGEVVAQYATSVGPAKGREKLLAVIGTTLGMVGGAGTESVTHEDLDQAVKRTMAKRSIAFAGMALSRRRRVAGLLAGLPLAFAVLKRAGVVKQDTYGEFLVHVLGVG